MAGHPAVDWQFCIRLIFVCLILLTVLLQLKEKKKQIFLKTTSEGRQRARQKRAEEELQREKQNQLEEEKRL